jgi:hypothetical protein
MGEAGGNDVFVTISMHDFSFATTTSLDLSKLSVKPLKQDPSKVSDLNSIYHLIVALFELAYTILHLPYPTLDSASTSPLQRQSSMPLSVTHHCVTFIWYTLCSPLSLVLLAKVLIIDPIGHSCLSREHKSINIYKEKSR